MRALIVGIDSSIGQALAHSLEKMNWLVSGTSRRPENRPRVYHLDLETMEGSKNLPECDHLFLCAALTNFSACRENPLLARKVNVDGPKALIERFSPTGTHIVLLSTSAVFDGSLPRQKAEDTPNPTTEYGRTKTEAEKVLLSINQQSAILRLTKVLSPKMPLFSGWVESLKKGNFISAFYNMFLAPITLDDAVESIIALAIQKRSGIFQASATEDISYLEAALYLAKKLVVDSSLVVGMSAEDKTIPSKERPRFTCLEVNLPKSSKMKESITPFNSIDYIL